ncbi:hypothetical protein [Methylomonas sp. UP202]|uniref:hypothetical protein n=1 Tax=Methylomonas sp. UP202 TaxID=3040943 RepID=UPI00247A033B|nr:hypothetical protein [Methylomonas sp. UP202]WGS84386.1 hypothetical protein QC632_15150 [Methylomonas sp. UP202]
MNKFLASAALLLTFSQAEAHSHPGIDNLSHSLEHLILSYQHWLPYLAAGTLSLVAIASFKRWANSRRSSK